MSSLQSLSSEPDYVITPFLLNIIFAGVLAQGFSAHAGVSLRFEGFLMFSDQDKPHTAPPGTFINFTDDAVLVQRRADGSDLSVDNEVPCDCISSA